MAPTMAPTSWDVPSYDASALVEELHGYSHTEDDDKYYYNGDMYAWVWGLTIMCGSFLMIIMWLFSICSWLPCFRKCCTPFFGHCYGPKGDHGLAGLFLVALLVLCCSYFPRGEFLDAAAEVGEAVGDLENVFKNLDAEVRAPRVSGRAPASRPHRAASRACDARALLLPPPPSSAHRSSSCRRRTTRTATGSTFRCARRRSPTPSARNSTRRSPALSVPRRLRPPRTRSTPKSTR